MNRATMIPMRPASNEDRRECDPTFTLDRHITRARREMGEARWAELQREFSAAPSASAEAQPARVDEAGAGQGAA